MSNTSPKCPLNFDRKNGNSHTERIKTRGESKTLESVPKKSRTLENKHVPINKFNYKETPLFVTFQEKVVEIFGKD